MTGVYGGDCHLCAHALAHHRGETYGHTPCDDCAMCTYNATSAAITDLLRAHPDLLTEPMGVHAAAKAAMERKSHPLLDRLRAEMQAAPTGEADRRNPVCVEAWPECEDGAYNPACCRFPKSCSCGGEADR